MDLERELVAAALAFRAAAPWNRILNRDYLLVDEGAAGRRALIVLGNGGMQYGLQSYSPACAAQWLYMIEESKGMPEVAPAVVLELLEGESLELETKSQADKRDLARLKRVGYKPAQGEQQAWPLFRQLRPNHLPWHIEEVAARRLIGDLQRALRWMEIASDLEGYDCGITLALRKVPVVAADLTTQRAWTAADVQWVQLELPALRRPEALVVSTVERDELKNKPVQPGEWLWLDERPQLMPIKQGADAAPYFPRLGVCLDGRSGIAFPPGMGPASRPYGMAAFEALAVAIRTRGARPGEVRMPNEFLAMALAPALAEAGIPVKVQAAGEDLEQFWSVLAQFG